MVHIIVGAICAVLGVVLYQDVKGRSVHLLVLMLYLGLAIPFFFFVRSFIYVDVLLNVGYLILLLGIAIPVVSRVKSVEIGKVFGSGDLVFLFVSTLYFDFPGFIIWLNFALIACLVLHFVASFLSDNYREQKLVPLAGFLAVIFAPALIFEIYARPVSFFIY